MSIECATSREITGIREFTTVYFNAGGRGTRLETVIEPDSSTGVTKALIEYAGLPVIQHLVNLFLALGFKNIIVGAGDHKNVEEYFHGHRDDRLSVSCTEAQEGTGGDLIKALQSARDLGKYILVLNVDTFVYVKIDEFLLQHRRTNAEATIVLTRRKNVPHEDAFFVDEEGRVVYNQEASRSFNLKRPDSSKFRGYRGSSTGIVIFNQDMLLHYPWFTGKGSLSIYADILPTLMEGKGLYAYDNGTNFMIEAGTPEPFERTQRHARWLFPALLQRYFRDN